MEFHVIRQPIRRAALRALAALALGGVSFMLLAATARAAPPSGAVEDALEASIARGLAWVLQQDELEVGDLYALQQLQRVPAQARVRAELAARAGSLGPFEGLVRPGTLAARPKEWDGLKGQRYAPIATWLYHASNAPAVPTPEPVLKELLAGSHSEYLLAHQYLALRILSERGVITGPGLAARLEQLLRDIEGEQRAEAGFSDLFAERQALLLSGGRVPPDTLRWIARILVAQEDDGHWRVPRHPYPTTLNETHTTLVSLWALDAYARILATRSAAPPTPTPIRATTP